jgi:hypothetical protein
MTWGPLGVKQLRELRRQQRELKRANPAFHRMIKRLSDAQLDALEASLIEQQLTRLRRQPGFERDAAAQAEVANHEYDLRLINSIAMWRAAPRPPIRRLRYTPEPSYSAPTPLPGPDIGPPSVVQPVALFSGPANAPAPVEPAPAPAEPPSNVVPFPRCYAKAFHGGRELGPGYS